MFTARAAAHESTRVLDSSGSSTRNTEAPPEFRCRRTFDVIDLGLDLDRRTSPEARPTVTTRRPGSRLGPGVSHCGRRGVSADQVSAGDVDVDGLVGHRGDEVVLGSGHTGVGPREGLARANRVERALVHRSGVHAADDDLVALRLQLVDRGIDGRWARRGARSGCGQCERGRCQCARGQGGQEDVLHCRAFLVFL